MIVGQMMAPEARSKHGSNSPECADAVDIRALKPDLNSKLGFVCAST